jgi:hypothetical protein
MIPVFQKYEWDNFSQVNVIKIVEHYASKIVTASF